MNRGEIIQAVRENTRDFTQAIFRTQMINRYINEGIDRIAQVIPELQEINYLESDTQELELLPKRYHQLLVFYTTGRCFGQDENAYDSVQYLNEFEVKLEELKFGIDAGDVVIQTEYGDVRYRRNEYVSMDDRNKEFVQFRPELYEE